MNANRSDRAHGKKMNPSDLRRWLNEERETKKDSAKQNLHLFYTTKYLIINIYHEIFIERSGYIDIRPSSEVRSLLQEDIINTEQSNEKQRAL